MAIEKSRAFIGAGDGAPDVLPHDLRKVINEFTGLRQIYRSAIEDVVSRLDDLDAELIHRIESRLKSPQSMVEKMTRRGLDISIESIRANLTDIAGVRIICYYIDDIYKIADLLLKQDSITIIRRSDYIASPKQNGYRSLHLVVKTPVDLSGRKEHVPVEIQIRTIAMDFWASLEHQIRYKKKTDIPDSILDELRICAEDIAKTDRKMQELSAAARGTARGGLRSRGGPLELPLSEGMVK